MEKSTNFVHRLIYIFLFRKESKLVFCAVKNAKILLTSLPNPHIDWRSICVRAGRHHIERSEFPQWTHGLKSPHGSLLCAGHILGNSLPVGLVRLLRGCQRDQMHAVDGKLWAVYNCVLRHDESESSSEKPIFMSRISLSRSLKSISRSNFNDLSKIHNNNWLCRKREFACLCGFRVWHSRNAPLTVTLTTFTLILCWFMSRIFSSSLTRQYFFSLLFYCFSMLLTYDSCYCVTLLLYSCGNVQHQTGVANIFFSFISSSLLFRVLSYFCSIRFWCSSSSWRHCLAEFWRSFSVRKSSSRWSKRCSRRSNSTIRVVKCPSHGTRLSRDWGNFAMHECLTVEFHWKIFLVDAAVLIISMIGVDECPNLAAKRSMESHINLVKTIQACRMHIHADAMKLDRCLFVSVQQSWVDQACFCHSLWYLAWFFRVFSSMR